MGIISKLLMVITWLAQVCEQGGRFRRRRGDAVSQRREDAKRGMVDVVRDAVPHSRGGGRSVATTGSLWAMVVAIRAAVPRMVSVEGGRGIPTLLSGRKGLLLLLLTAVLPILLSSPSFAQTTLELTNVSGPCVVYDLPVTLGPSLFTIGLSIKNTGTENAANVQAVLNYNANGSWTYGFGESTSSGTITSGTATRSFLTPLAPNATYTAYWTVAYPLGTPDLVHTFTITVSADNASPVVYNGTLTTKEVATTGAGGAAVGTIIGIVGGVSELTITYDYGNMDTGAGNDTYVQPTGNKAAVGTVSEIIFDASIYRLQELWGTYTSSYGTGTFTDKLYFPVHFFGNSTFVTAHYKFICLASGSSKVVPYGAKTGAQNQYNNSYNDAGNYIDMSGTNTLTLNKSVNFATITPTGTLTYTIVYQNTSATYTASFIVTTDVIPVSTTYVPNSASGNGTYSAATNKITWDIGDVGPGVQGTLTFQARVNNVPGGTIITNTAGIYIADNASPTVTSATTTTVYNVAPQVHVVSPNGGEYWDGTKTITWTYLDKNGTTTIGYIIEYSTVGTTWLPITSGSVAGTGNIATSTYVWDTVPIPEGTYTIRVVGTDTYAGAFGPAPGIGTDTSDSYFTIDQTPPSLVPTVDGEGTAPDTMIPGITDTEDLIKVVISGSIIDTGTITWEMLDLRFTNDGTTALTTTQFGNLFANIFFYLDTGDGTFSNTSDTGIATFSAASITLDNGVATFTLPSTTDFQVVSPGTKTYFIV
ncbi:MAG: hypothetical protein AAB296_02055, partial [Candidatus Desantisbacteria bacterium]